MNQYPGGYQPQQPRQGKNLFLIGAFSLIIVAALTVMTVVLINRNKDRSAENIHPG